MITPEIPAGIILVLMGGLIVAIPFVSRPMSAVVEARWNAALVTTCATIILTYVAAIAASLIFQ